MSLVLNVEILGEFKKLTSASQGAQNELQGLNGKIGQFSDSAKRMFASIGVGLSFALVARELKEATQAALDDRKAQGLLADQLVKSTGANDAEIASVEKSIAKLQTKAAIADDKLRPAMAQLARVTGDNTESLKLLNLATDISAGSGKDLTTVTMALSKAYQGKMAALTKLGIPMTDAIENASRYSTEMTKLTKLQTDANFAVETYGAKSKEATAALEKVGAQQDLVNRIAESGIDWQKQLGDAFGGAAEKAANLDPYARMKIIFENIQEQVGGALLPALDKLGTWLASPKGEETIQKVSDALTEMVGWLGNAATWAMENGDWLVPLIGGLAGMAAAWKAITVAVNATKAAIALATAAQIAFNKLANDSAVPGTTKLPTKSVPAGNKVVQGLGILGTVATVLSIPGSSQLYGNTGLKDLGKPLSVPNAPAIVNNNVTVNNNQGTMTGSDITTLLKQFGNQTGTN